MDSVQKFIEEEEGLYQAKSEKQRKKILIRMNRRMARESFFDDLLFNTLFLILIISCLIAICRIVLT